ncbi:MAG: methyltransferase domain-containing protein [Thermodesulfobacteriota bacterium]
MNLQDNAYSSPSHPPVRFPIRDGIILALQRHGSFESDVSGLMREFYEENPFPNYEPNETLGSLIGKSKARVFPEMLNRSIRPNSAVLEVGCGTGQLSNFLGIARRRVLGVDMSLGSLSLAEEFRSRNRLNTVAFAQMNLFEMPLQPESFDTIISLGVLHHTSDPEGGLKAILRFLKKDGHIIVGLYNRYGRVKTHLRRALFSVFGERFLSLDPYVRSYNVKWDKRKAWFMDQYRNPHESCHTMDEVLDWLDRGGVRFIRAVPSTVFGSSFSLEYKRSLLEEQDRGSAMDRMLSQLRQMVYDTEGGLFVVVGRKE